MDNGERQYELEDELLSAYLDGELSDEERMRVEARLETDPAARQLLAELREASAAVRGLPRAAAPAAVGAGLWEAVARAQAPAAPLEPASVTNNELRRSSRKRAAAWAALAMAASLAMMAFLPGENADEQKKVAQARSKPATEAVESESIDKKEEEKSDAATLVVEGAARPAAEDSTANADRRLRRMAPGAPASPAEEPAAAPSSAVIAAHRGIQAAKTPVVPEVRTAGESLARDEASATYAVRLAQPAAAKEFEQLLLRNNIQLVEADAGGDLEEELRDDADAANEIDALAKDKAADGTRSATELATQDGYAQSTAGAARGYGGSLGRYSRAAKAAGDRIAAVLIEATPTQIAEVLNACQQDASNFTAVEDQTGAGETSTLEARAAENLGRESINRALADSANRSRSGGIGGGRSGQGFAQNRANEQESLGYGGLSPSESQGAAGAAGRAGQLPAVQQGRALRVYLPRGLARSHSQAELNSVMQVAVDRNRAAYDGSRLAANPAATSPAMPDASAPAASESTPPSFYAHDIDGAEPQVRVLFLLDSADAAASTKASKK